MIKKTGIYLLGFGLVSLLGYFLHVKLFSGIAAESPINLVNLYLFFGVFSLMLCLLFALLQKTEKFKDQLGFLYLVSFALKIAIFCFVFFIDIFTEDSFTNRESVNMLIPMSLTLFLEVFFISKLLKHATPLKNAN